MDKAAQTMIDNMPEKTGKSLDAWKQLLKAKAFEKHGQAMKFLKEEHGVSHGFANTIILLSKEDNSTDEDLVQAQYKGKESLLPIYEKLLLFCRSLGKDVQVNPKKGSVSFVRKRQFALVKPATKSRIDLGLKLPGIAVEGRLENSGPFGSMCTHRMQLHEADEVDETVKNWIKQAYDMAD